MVPHPQPSVRQDETESSRAPPPFYAFYCMATGKTFLQKFISDQVNCCCLLLGESCQLISKATHTFGTFQRDSFTARLKILRFKVYLSKFCAILLCYLSHQHRYFNAYKFHYSAKKHSKYSYLSVLLLVLFKICKMTVSLRTDECIVLFFY